MDDVVALLKATLKQQQQPADDLRKSLDREKARAEKLEIEGKELRAKLEEDRASHEAKLEDVRGGAALDVFEAKAECAKLQEQLKTKQQLEAELAAKTVQLNTFVLLLQDKDRQISTLDKDKQEKTGRLTGSGAPTRKLSPPSTRGCKRSRGSPISSPQLAPRSSSST